MLYTHNEFANDRDDHSEREAKPNAYRVDDGNNIEESDLKKHLLFGEDERRPIMEGQPMGGQSFGVSNTTPTGDDKNNPSQNAGYSNAYFARTRPSEEHPENSDFRSPDQQGEPDYSKSIHKASGEGDNNGDKAANDDKDKDDSSKAEPNIPGPNELSDQQKVGEDDEDKYHVET
jgi:hypothetical protein